MEFFYEGYLDKEICKIFRQSIWKTLHLLLSNPGKLTYIRLFELFRGEKDYILKIIFAAVSPALYFPRTSLILDEF